MLPDSAYTQGWKGPHKFFVLFCDAFSRKYFCRCLVKLNAISVSNAFEDIVANSNQGNYPNTILTDRGKYPLS